MVSLQTPWRGISGGALRLLRCAGGNVDFGDCGVFGDFGVFGDCGDFGSLEEGHLWHEL